MAFKFGLLEEEGVLQQEGCEEQRDEADAEEAKQARRAGTGYMGYEVFKMITHF